MEKRQYGKTEIKIPWITSLRDSPIYRTGAGEINTMLQTEGMDAFKYLYSNCTIDGNEVMEPKLHVFAMYLGDYCKRFDYVIDEIVPDPEQVYPCIVWEEETQLIPKVIFQDLNYDEYGFFKTGLEVF